MAEPAAAAPAREGQRRPVWNPLIRQAHRWLSIAFTLGFIVNTVVIVGRGQKQPPTWLYLLAIIPLFLLLPTGLYLFALPYVAKGSARATGA